MASPTLIDLPRRAGKRIFVRETPPEARGNESLSGIRDLRRGEMSYCPGNADLGRGESISCPGKVARHPGKVARRPGKAARLKKPGCSERFRRKEKHGVFKSLIENGF